MSKAYWIKKDPNCNLEEIDWIELNGIEFYQFINSPEGKGRYFIDFDDMKIETDKAEYVKWRKEKDHKDYLLDQEAKYTTLSINSLFSENSTYYEELVPDITIDIESEVEVKIIIENVQKAILTLNHDERSLIYSLFFRQNPKSEAELSKDFNINQSSLNKRKKKIFSKIKKFWE